MNKISTFFIALTTVLSLLTNGCSNNSNKSANFSDTAMNLAEAQALCLNLYSEPPSLNPGKANDSTSLHVIKMLFEGLTRIQPNGKPSPAIAKEIEVSDDLTTYRFILRDSSWSNGDPLSAYDFEYAWKEALNPISECVYAYQLYPIKNAEGVKAGKIPMDELGVEVIDEKTLLVTLERPTPYFLELTTFPTYYPIHKSIAAKNPKWSSKASDDFVTNGPFKLLVWKHHDKLEVVKNENYWDNSSVKLKKISMLMISDESTELKMFENNELHWAGRPISRLPADAIPSLRKEGKLNSQPVAGVEWYKFNTGRFPFNNLKMRKAFSYAINRQIIIDKLMPDNHVAATGIVPKPLSTHNMPFFQDGDIVTAREFFREALEELNIKKEDLPTITLSYNSNEAHHRLAQAIQQQWNRCFDMEISLEASEWKAHINKLRKHDFQIGRLGWIADFRDPINFLEVFKFKNDLEYGGNNDTQWESKEYISMLNKSSNITDEEERRKVLLAAESLFMEEMPVAPIYFMTDNYVKDSSLKGAYLSGLGDVDFKWAYFESKE